MPNASATGQLHRLLRDRRQGRPAGPVEILTRDELYDRFPASLADPPRRLTPFERDVIAQAAAREAAAALGTGASPVFQLRPGLVAEMLRFYDQLRRQGQQVARFEELLEDTLRREAEFDRGAERMLQQTRLLAGTFRAYERRVAESGSCDEHSLRDRLIAAASAAPVRGIVITVADWIADPGGLYSADFDLLTRLPGIETIDLVVTQGVLASGFHQRIRDWLPGMEEIDWDLPRRLQPMLSVPAAPPDRLWFTSRDREEELIGIARRFKADRREAHLDGLAAPTPDRFAVVYKRPLPYLYLADSALGGASIPYQTSDTLPLAAEPIAAALDLVLEFVASSFTRDALIALLRSPHFEFGHGAPMARRAVSVLDRALSDARYLGEIEALAQLEVAWEGDQRRREALTALSAAVRAAKELAPLRAAAPASVQIQCLLQFLEGHQVAVDLRPAGEPEVPADAGPPPPERRARTAIVETLAALAAANRAHDDPPVDIDGLAAIVRRWMEEQTFAPLRSTGTSGMHLVDEHAARYGDFDAIALVGLIAGEWPERPRRNIFYSPNLLSALGWPPEKDWRAAAEARFIDLLRSANQSVSISTITLDDEALVEPSPLLDEIPRAGLSSSARDAAPPGRIFVDEGLSLDPVALDALPADSRRWAEMRQTRSAAAAPMFHGQAGTVAARPWSVSAVETYLQCPFRFFAQHVLRLEEEPDDEEVMDPRQQGLFMHRVFEAFFNEWQQRGYQAIVPANLDQARQVFEQIVERSLAALSETEAALERTRLLGSSAAVGLGEAVLRMEVERRVGVVARLLEYRLDGEFTFDTPSGPRVIALRGKADRIDLLEDGTLRLIDYKLGWPPQRTRVLQLAIYSLCAEQRLRGYLGRTWTIGEAAYLAFKGPRRVVPLFAAADREKVFAEAQTRLVDAVDAISRGEFPPRPHDVYLCETCAYAAVCRTDYVDDV
ncbi:MAG: PD-(D/E)XK nuclease family protein [Acidobacteriota bacterium]